MTEIEKIAIVAAIVGVAWLGYQKMQTPQVSSRILSAPADPSAPWYLQYNTTPPVPSSFANGGTTTTPAQALSYNATGIQNTESEPCSACSMFGAAFGAQY